MSFNIIYVLTPYGVSTGGVELLHQLVDCLRKNALNAFIVYEKDGELIHNPEVCSEYRSYNVKTCSTIVDSRDNMLILPEIYFSYVSQYSNIYFGCWWLSVNNRYRACSLMQKLQYASSIKQKFEVVKRYLKKYEKCSPNDNRLLKKNDKRIFHFYQSVYAQCHLYNLGFSKILPLSDYINCEFWKNNSMDLDRREDVVLYNPSKGFEITKKIIAFMPEVHFVPIVGYDRTQMIKLFQSSKLYIDFGSFPGKDRLPRETVLCDCCLITGKDGASFYFEDVAIDDSYKFDLRFINIEDIAQRIRYVLANYNICCKDFEFYKARILREQDVFEREVVNFFKQ